MTNERTVTLPSELLPADGRFGSGPSKVRQEVVERLAEVAPGLLGTSHRKAAVKDQVRRIRTGMAELFALPEGYEVVLGNGGATLFWDAATFSIIARRSAHAVFGEFSSKFAAASAAAPFLADPLIETSEPGGYPQLTASDEVDTYALTHNETSTGVAMPIRRPAGAQEALVLVDATSGAGGLPVDPVEFDVYYLSPQKGFASEGGLFVALCSPAALRRIEQVTSGDRHVPTILDLQVAVENSRSDQTYNTPSISTLFLMGEQIEWMLGQGGLEAVVAQCRAKADHVYGWAEERAWAQPFVTDPADRSTVVCTIDLDDAISADEVSAVLRANGILDTEAYRKLGRNQLRLATFPAVDLADVQRLTACIDHVVEQLT